MNATHSYIMHGLGFALHIASMYMIVIEWIIGCVAAYALL
jgi:hypothetical protein